MNPTAVTSDQELADLVDRAVDLVEAARRDEVEALVAAYPAYSDRLRAMLPAIEALAASDDTAPAEVSRFELEEKMLGEFRIVREIGRGGMGVVYEAEQTSVARRVALKVLPFASMLKSQQLDRFRNEVRAAGSLSHPHIVAVYSVGVERGVHFYAMQLVEGQSLAAAIRERQEQSGAGGRDVHTEVWSGGGDHSAAAATQAAVDTQPVAAASTLRDVDPADYFRVVAGLGRQVAEALDHAHQRGVVHRDIKPANLLMSEDEHVWVADFGLARLEADAGMTASGDLLGTLRYMSPEQAAGDRAVVDHRTDIYSLGVTLYELLALRPAFDSQDRQQLLRDVTDTTPEPLRSVDPRIPADLETIVAKAMEKDPADRYATAAELAADLGAFVEDRPITAQPPSLVSRLRRWGRRRPGVVIALLAALLLTTIGSAIAVALVSAANHRAQVARSNAEENLRVAAATIDKLLARVGDDAKAHGQLRHADKLLREAVASYDDLLLRSDDPQLVLKAASANDQLSQVLRLGAEFVEAQRVADDGIQWLAQLPDEIAQSEAGIVTRASLLASSGMALLSRRDYARAEWPLRESLELYGQLTALRPASEAHRKGLLLAHNSLGVLLMESERLDEGEEQLRAALALHTALPTADQATPDGLNRRAGLRANLAAIAVKRGELAGVEDAFRDAIRLQRRVVAALPEDPVMREHLYQFRWSLADALVRLGRYDDAADEVASFSEEFAERLQAQVEGVWLLVECLDESSGGSNYLDRAKQLIERSKSSSFAPPAIQQELAWLLATCPLHELRDGEGARQIAARLCQIDPRNDEKYHALAAALLELGEFDAAYAAAKQAYSLDGHGGDAYELTLLALGAAGMGESEEAQRWSAKALKTHQAIGDHPDLGLRALVDEMQEHVPGGGS